MAEPTEGIVTDALDTGREGDPMRCEHCQQRFADADLLALHQGLEHEGTLTTAEREAFETAYNAEAEELRLFRLKALLALVLLYFLLLFAYSVFG
jgi:hypothetical protein